MHSSAPGFTVETSDCFMFAASRFEPAIPHILGVARLGSAADRSSPPASRPHHHLDRFTVVHGSVAVGHLVEPGHPVEDPARFDSSFQDVGRRSST
jgi:hypothetical protein